MRGRVAVIKICKPPVNSLGLAVRKGIASGLDQAQSAGAKAVVIAGDGATFPAGADIQEFAHGGHLEPPMLGSLIERISGLGMHSIAAVHGTALGGGMELTLACHYRLMHEKAKFGLPEVHLGILPGASGTQRLPRLVGCEDAIKMMTTGMMINAKAALSKGLCDEVVGATDASVTPSETMIDRAVAFAEASLCDVPVDPKRVVADQSVPDPGEGFFEAAKAQTKKAAKGEVRRLTLPPDSCAHWSLCAASYLAHIPHAPSYTPGPRAAHFALAPRSWLRCSLSTPSRLRSRPQALRLGWRRSKASSWSSPWEIRPRRCSRSSCLSG